jgi:hypothetical protein
LTILFGQDGCETLDVSVELRYLEEDTKSQ